MTYACPILQAALPFPRRNARPGDTAIRQPEHAWFSYCSFAWKHLVGNVGLRLRETFGNGRDLGKGVQIKSLARNLGMFAALGERRYAREASEQLLGLFWREQREHPELNGRRLYEAVIARRIGSNPAISAAEIVKRAKESFADWPVERDLCFRDVVHYQIFDEFTRHGEELQGTRTNIGDAVARVVPEDL